MKNFDLKTAFKMAARLACRFVKKTTAGLILAASLAACAIVPTPECAAEGARVPPQPAKVFVAGSSESATICDKKGRSCSTYSDFMPPHFETVDANAPLRDQIISACMARPSLPKVTP